MSFFLPKKNVLFFLICMVFFAIGVQAQWTARANALRKRSETTSVVYNNKIYTFLGFKNADLEPEPSSEVYDPATDKWTLLASIPSNKAMTHQGVVLIDDKVWHIGGRVGEHPGPLTSETWIYNISTNKWSAGPQLLNPATGQPLRWGGGGAALVGRTLHVYGGFANTACRGDQAGLHLTLDVDAWMANPKKPAPWKNESAPMPVPRNHMGTAVLGGKIYAIGGQFGHDCGQGIDTVYAHVYDPASDAWTALTPLPMARSHVEGSIFAADGKIYVLAGQSSKNANTNLVTEFDPAGNGGAGSWADRPDLTLPRKYEGLSAKALGDMFFISHGGEGLSNNTRQYAYTATVARNPMYQLGFPAQCANVSIGTGQSVQGKALLFTIDGVAEYTATSSAPWLKISKNVSGEANQNGSDIYYTVDASGLAVGNYTATITAQPNGSSPGFSPATYCINVTVQAMPEISVPAEVVFSGVKGRTSATQQVAIKNSGDGPLQVTSLAFGGADAAAFKMINIPEVPFTVAAGESYNLELQFAPSLFQVGSLSATLSVGSNDANEGTSTVGLYGLSANGEQGNNEPPLDAVVKTLGYNINVGGTKLVIGTGAGALGDEVLLPLFKKAENGPVTMQPVARYSPDDLLAYGYYIKADGKPQTTEIGKVALDYEQSLNPGITSGSKTAFDPGNSIFGLFTGATSYANQNTYTEDEFNTGPLPHSARIYPLKNRAGIAVANSYLVAFEPAANGDYQDYVFVLSNVKPAYEVETLEAEDAALNGVAVAYNHDGYSGTGFADYEDDEEGEKYIEWTVKRPVAGPMVALFRYAISGTSTRNLRLEVNGKVVNSVLTFRGTGDWTNWSNRTETVNLVAGTNKIRLTATGSSGPNVDYLFLRNLTVGSVQSPNVLEAEDAVVSGATLDAEHRGYTGTGFVNFINPGNDFVEWELVKPTSGVITLSFRYANGSKLTRAMQLSVNGAVVNPSLEFPVTSGWTKWQQVTVTVNVAAGANKIRLTANGESGPNMDHLAWEEESGIAEAEWAQLGGAMSVSDKVPGFTGTGYADIVNKSNDYVEWTVVRPAAGATVLQFRYGNGHVPDKPLRLQVNGERITERFWFPSTGSWNVWDTVSITVQLEAGENKVRLTSIGYNGPHLDHLKWYDAADIPDEGGRITARSLPELKTTSTFSVVVAPNPANGPANLIVNGEAGKLEIAISNMNGKLHKKWVQQWEGLGSIPLPVQGLTPGLYLVQVRQGNQTTATKLIIR